MAGNDLLRNGPKTLERLCTTKILDNILLPYGNRVENRAKNILGGNPTPQERSSEQGTVGYFYIKHH